MAVRVEPPPQLPAEPLARTIDAAAAPTAGPGPLVTQRLGRFVVLRLLGEGGMGLVYAAYDEQLDRRVAVKLLRPIEGEAATHLQRVLREAQAMARVAHENVVHVYEVGEISGQIFIAMEFIDGTTLTDWQRQETRSWQELLGVYRQAAQGLQAAHQMGLVHRDFKPDNVLIDRSGRARVVDFGLARLQGDTTVGSAVSSSGSPSALLSPITRDGAIAGTLGYMSPEQARGAGVDARGDQFSFCVALYQALYRQAPFASLDMVDAINPGPPRSPSASSPVPLALFQALSRGLAGEPAARFPSMSELIEALFQSSTGEAAATRKRRHQQFAISLAIVLSVTVFLAVKRTSSTLRVVDLTVLSAIMFVVFGFITLAAWRKIRTSMLQFEITLRALCFLATSVCLRGMALYLQLDAKTLIPIDLAVAGGLATSYAYPHLPLLWAAAAGFELAAVATVVWPQYGTPIANSAYTIAAIGIYYAWERAVNRRAARGGAS